MRRNRPNQTSHTVRSGDTLGDIAQIYYGDANVWSELARANSLRNPNLILVGQRLLLPTLLENKPAPVAKPSPISPSPPPSRFIPYASAIAMEFPEVSISLSSVPQVHFLLGPYRARLELKGNLKFRKKGTVSHFAISDFEKLEFTAKEEARFAMFDLAREAKLEFDPAKRTLELKCGLSMTLKTKYGMTQTHKLEVGVGTLKFSCEPTPVKGTFRELEIEGTFGWAVTIAGDNLGNSAAPAISPARSLTNSYQSNPQLLIVVVATGVMAAILIVVTLPVSAAALATAGVAVVTYAAVKQSLDKPVHHYPGGT